MLATPPPPRTPHDPVRLGLPIAALVPGDDDQAASAALLAAAALLLAACGAGGMVVGVSTRRMARGA